MEYRTAPEIENVARDLIEDYHPVIGSRGPIIDWVMVRSTGATEPRMFQIKKVTGINAFLAARPRPENFYTEPQAPDRVVVLVGKFPWQTMTEAQQKGLVDHMLHHLRYDADKEAWRIEPPEYGEFPEVLERHGFWRPDDTFKDFAEAVSEQLSLLPDEDREKPESADQESLDVSITANGRTVHTNTETMRKIAEGDFVDGPNGEKAGAETGEVLEGAPA